MDLYKDVLSVEDGEGDDAALQRIINRGMWSLQGSFGRTMMAAIEEGRCLLGPAPARDYWGNFIPSRDQVKPGTKGSWQYVAERFGEEHANAMLEV